MNVPKRIAVDFDNTLCDGVFPEIGKVKPGAKEALAIFRTLGYRVIIWSCRTCHWDYDVFGGNPEQPTLERSRVKEMIEWLDANGIEYDEVDDGSRGKPGADFYIDDRAIRFEDNWNDIAFHVLNTVIKQRLGVTNSGTGKQGALIPFPIGTATAEPNGPERA